jgi:Rrf2 family iron-sulfur cluster assembly transcriptional regulator
MRLTTKGRYAVTAMLDLAINAQHGPVNLNDISDRQSISVSYLEQLFAKLRKSALVNSVRGPGGGYQLARGADGIYVAQIIDAVDESVDVTRCGGQGDCHISLQALVARREVQTVAIRQSEQQQRRRQDGAQADTPMQAGAQLATA